MPGVVKNKFHREYNCENLEREIAIEETGGLKGVEVDTQGTNSYGLSCGSGRAPHITELGRTQVAHPASFQVLVATFGKMNLPQQTPSYEAPKKGPFAKVTGIDRADLINAAGIAANAQ